MKILLSSVLLFLLSGALFAQNTTSVQKKITNLYNEALNLSQQGNSEKSSQLLYQILQLDSTFFMADFALADLSHEAGKTVEEIGYLRKGLSLSGDTYMAGYKFLSEVLFKKGEYSEALTRMEQYARLRKSLNSSEELHLASCRFSAAAIQYPVQFQPVDPGDSINTVAEEYWPSLNAEANELVFTRLETTNKFGNKISRPQEDFFVSMRDSNGWHKAVPLGAPVNSEENEGAQTLSADGQWLIFSGCGRIDGFGSCDLYISKLKNGKWITPVNMGEGVNSGAWESQPSLSSDGETLYFVSSRKGGKGKMDIWKAAKIGISPDGIPQFGNATNVSELNTPGNDSSPFIHADGKTLYFASDGRPGLGGSDLFITRQANGHFCEPLNLGYPINTCKNEDGLVVEISGQRAWFSSDRNPLHGKDIFSFSLVDSLQPSPASYLKGIVEDAKTGQKIRADIVLSDLRTNKFVRKISASENEGSFLICLPAGSNYGLSISATGYLFASENISLVDGFTQKKPKEIKILLQPVTIGASTNLKNIFFETNSWRLKEESQIQLNEMAEFMMKNPNVVMEVIGHTDKVGTESYNLELSTKRAETVANELKIRKIEPYRIKSRGVGYANPIGDNTTEEGRSLNRRTEFLVKEIMTDK